MSNCPVCKVQVTVPSAPRCSEIFECEDCRSELEIVAVAPLLLAVAPEVEEDWGE